MFSGMLAGFLKVAAVAVVTGGFVGGIYWAVQVGGSDGSSAFGQGEPSVTVTITPEDTPTPLTATPTALPPTQPPPTEAPPTDVPPATEPPATAEQTKWPTLAGGQWYRLSDCIDFYLPAGWTFRLVVGIADPGGGFFTFWEDSSGSSLGLVPESLSETGRSVLDPALGPAFDQLVATLERSC